MLNSSASPLGGGGGASGRNVTQGGEPPSHSDPGFIVGKNEIYKRKY